jgi:hypothetical protein
MKIIGLNGKHYHIDLKKYLISQNDTKKRSTYHISVRNLLLETYKGYTILEEVKLPGSTKPSKRSALFLDFLIPNLMLGIEIHGRQHYEYCEFFHKTKAGFLSYKTRDNDKARWCEANNINLIVLKYSDGVEHWRKQLER